VAQLLGAGLAGLVGTRLWPRQREGIAVAPPPSEVVQTPRR
jgi:hypothetical protein